MNHTATINPENLPKHLAIIMDGNGRWAKKKGMMRVFGHENGTKAVSETVESCARLGIENRTLCGLSTENGNRPKFEGDPLIKRRISSLKKELKKLQKNEITLNTIGNLEMLPPDAHEELKSVIEQTKNNSRMTLTRA